MFCYSFLRVFCVCCATVTVLEEHYNPRLIKELLQDLSCTVHALTKGVGKCVLVGSINVWLLRLDTIHHWQLQLHNLDIPKVLPSWGKDLEGLWGLPLFCFGSENQP